MTGSHNIKVGYDFQNLESGSQFDFPGARLYLADDYVQATNTPVFVPAISQRPVGSVPPEGMTRWISASA